MTRYAGHLFVVHGTIETLIHDAAVVPVGAEYRFEEHWRTLVGDHPVLPDDWSRRRWGRIHNAPDRVWAVSVGGSRADPYDVVVERIVNVLRRVDERRHLHKPERGNPPSPSSPYPSWGSAAAATTTTAVRCSARWSIGSAPRRASCASTWPW